MKDTILISIKPIFVERILNGTKKFEYRKQIAKQKITKIVIYSTSPEKIVVGEVEVLGVLKENPENLWEKTKEFSGIEKSFFDSYFQNQKNAYAYELGEVKVYPQPKQLFELGIKQAPQSFIYL